MKTKIIIDLDEILERVYAESARRAIGEPGVAVFTADQARLLEQHIESGFGELRVRLGGYVTLASFNPNADTNHIVLHLALRHTAGNGIEPTLHHAIVELLAHYTLMRLYGDANTWYGTAWRKYRAQVLLILARDQLALA
ncbi:MAG: hypothetical protein IJT30_00105 [Muribaculaceae bacterium]|nr:hypothetical protein [Muribaculaceae bacterium]